MFTYPYPSWEAVCRDQSTDFSEMHDRKAVTVAQMRELLTPRQSDAIAPKRIVSWPVTATLMVAATRRGGQLAVVDFGGAFGEYYYQNLEFLKHLSAVAWHVVEQPAVAARARRDGAPGALHFHDALDDALRAGEPDVLLLSSVLQYLPDPYGLLDRCVAARPRYVAIDRTLLGISVSDVVGMQVVPSNAYNPPLSQDLRLAMRFINVVTMHQRLSPRYRLLEEFPSYFDSAADRPNEYVFRGFIYERRADA